MHAAQNEPVAAVQVQSNDHEGHISRQHSALRDVRLILSLIINRLQLLRWGRGRLRRFRPHKSTIFRLAAKLGEHSQGAGVAVLPDRHSGQQGRPTPAKLRI